MKRCPFCAEEIQDAAIVCKHCGRDLQTGTLPGAPTVYRAWSPGVAALLSFILPGAGQMYKGQVFNGLAWMLVVIVGYLMFIVPGIVLHLCCIIGASMGNPIRTMTPPALAPASAPAAAQAPAAATPGTAERVGRAAAEMVHGRSKPPVTKAEL